MLPECFCRLLRTHMLLVSFRTRWNSVLLVEQFPIGGTVSYWWNSFLLVEQFHIGGTVSYWWNCFLLVELFPIGGTVSYWLYIQSFSCK